MFECICVVYEQFIKECSLYKGEYLTTGENKVF